MKIEIQGKTLLDALQLLSKIPTKHPAQPILSFIGLRVEDNGKLQVFASGLGIYGKVDIDIDTVQEMGEVAIDHQTLISFLSMLKTIPKLNIELVNGVLKVIAGDSIADLKTYPVDQMVWFSPVEGDIWFDGSSQLLSDSIKRVSFACATSDIRPELSSVFISIKQGFLICAATDSFYLAESKAPCDAGEDGSLLLPNKYVPHLLHMSSNFGRIKITQNEGNCQFDFGEATLVVRTINGSYPQYEQIIPSEFPIKIETNRDEVKNTLKTIQPFTDSLFPRIVIKPETESGICLCESEQSDKGYGKSSFRAVIMGNVENFNQIKVNLSNIMNILNVLSVDRVVFSMIDSMKPIMVTSPDDVNFRALLMPIGR